MPYMRSVMKNDGLNNIPAYSIKSQHNDEIIQGFSEQNSRCKI